MKKKCIGFLVVLVMLLQASAGAADVQQAAAVEPAPVEETTELGLVLADIPEAMSAEQTVEEMCISDSHVVVQTAEEIDRELLDWIHEAYLFSMAKEERRRERRGIADRRNGWMEHGSKQ